MITAGEESAPGRQPANGGRASLRRWLEKHSLLNPVGGIARQQIEQMQVPAARPPGPTPMGREDAQYASCTPDQRSRQYGAHSGIEHHLQGGRAQKNWALSNVLDDDLYAQPCRPQLERWSEMGLLSASQMARFGCNQPDCVSILAPERRHRISGSTY